MLVHQQTPQRKEDKEKNYVRDCICNALLANVYFKIDDIIVFFLLAQIHGRRAREN